MISRSLQKIIFFQNFFFQSKSLLLYFKNAKYHDNPTTLQSLAPKTIHNPPPEPEGQITVFIFYFQYTDSFQREIYILVSVYRYPPTRNFHFSFSIPVPSNAKFIFYFQYTGTLQREFISYFEYTKLAVSILYRLSQMYHKWYIEW